MKKYTVWHTKWKYSRIHWKELQWFFNETIAVCFIFQSHTCTYLESLTDAWLKLMTSSRNGHLLYVSTSDGAINVALTKTKVVTITHSNLDWNTNAIYGYLEWRLLMNRPLTCSIPLIKKYKMHHYNWFDMIL